MIFSHDLAKGLPEYFAFTSLVNARSIATVMTGDSTSIAVVDTDGVGESEGRLVPGQLALVFPVHITLASQFSELAVAVNFGYRLSDSTSKAEREPDCELWHSYQNLGP